MGLINYNYDPRYIKNKINSKVELINVDNLKKNIRKSKKNFLIKDGLWKNKTLWNLYTKSSMKISIQKKNILSFILI